MNYRLFGIFLLTLFSCTVFQDRYEISDIQKQFALSEDEAQRKLNLDRLDAYYLEIDVPDSVSEKIEYKLQQKLDDFRFNRSTLKKIDPSDIDDYRIDSILAILTESLIIMRCKELNSNFAELLIYAKEIAGKLNQHVLYNYWNSFFSNIENWDKRQALNRMRAKLAYNYCKIYHDKSKYWQVGELYGAFALQRLLGLNDRRLILDLKQRLQLILFYFRGYHDLSIQYAEILKTQAKQIAYHLRFTGIKYHQAEALSEAGQISVARERFKEIVDYARLHSRHPFMNWYERNGLLMLAYQYNHIGQYEVAYQTTEQLENYELLIREKMQFHLCRGMVYKNQGLYEKAESEFLKAGEYADSAESVTNKIFIFRDIGQLHYSLTEYQKALKYFLMAYDTTKKYNSENNELLSRTSMACAKTYHQLREYDLAASYAEDAFNMILKIGDMPLRRMELISTLGSFNLQRNNFELALSNFAEAENIAEEYGLFLVNIYSKLNSAKALLLLNRNDEAGRKISQVLSISEHFNDTESQIDALALKAELELKFDNIDNAVAISNDIKNRIDKITLNFSRYDLLTAFQ